MKAIDKSFLGRGWSFPPTFRREWYGIELLSEEADVESSLKIIISTITGERVMLPNFGCNLQPHVFDVMNATTNALIEKLVHDALVFHEPRIIVEEITTSVDGERGVMNINIGYSIIATNTRYNYVYPFYINEATNVGL